MRDRYLILSQQYYNEASAHTEDVHMYSSYALSAEPGKTKLLNLKLTAPTSYTVGSDLGYFIFYVDNVWHQV